MNNKMAYIHKAKSFTNPVLDENVADPTIWKSGDTYHLFYTGNFTSPIYTSKDMVNWTNTNQCPFLQETIDQLFDIAKDYGSDPVIYAPTVVKNDGLYLMYISLTWKCICVLCSTNPMGPFRFYNNHPYVLVDEKISGMNITFEDTCVAQDLDGQWYLMFGSHGNLTRTKLHHYGIDLLDKKFDHVAGCPKLFPRWIYEGLYAYYHDGYWYLFAAKGNYTSAKDPYEVVVGRCKTLGGVFRNKWGLRMDMGFASTILKPDSTNVYLGGAHTGEIFTDDNGWNYIYYQRQRANEIHFRPLFLQRIYWGKDGWPYFKDGVTQMEEIMPAIKTKK